MTLGNRDITANIHTSLFNQPLKPALAFGAVALCATSSQAGIVSTNVDFTTTPDSAFSVNYSGGDFIISSGQSSSGLFFFQAPISAGKSGYFNDTTINGGITYVTSALLSPGTVVGPASSWTGATFLTTADANLSNVYLGFEVPMSSGSHNYMYGYVQLSTGANYIPGNSGGFDNNGGPDITVTQIALDTTLNEPVTTPVPEPSSLALLGLAGGVAAMLRRRKTRTA
jgi:hypothetical protein